MPRKRTMVLLLAAVVVGLLLVPSMSSACHPSTAGQPNAGDRKIGNASVAQVWLTPPSSALNGDVGAGALNNKVWVEGQGSAAGGYLFVGIGKHVIGVQGPLAPPKPKPCIH